MQPNSEQTAAMYANAAAGVRATLEQIRRDVTGSPDRLAALADRYRGRADQLQELVRAVGAQARVLANTWTGEAATRAQDTAKRVTGGLGQVVRALRAEQAFMVRCSVELTKAANALGEIIAAFNTGAQRVIDSARAGAGFMELHGAWKTLVGTTVKQALRARADLAAVLAGAVPPGQQGWWYRTVGGLIESGLRLVSSPAKPAPNTNPMFPPAQLLDPKETEFSHTVSELVGRMNRDATSAEVRALVDAPLAKRLHDWTGLVKPGGEYDMKPFFDRMWQTSERNNVFIAMPPELGTLGGRPVEIDRDLLGNIHYGYVASAVGAQDWMPGWGGVATVGADVADMALYLDVDEGDRLGINLGRDLYGRLPAPAELTPQHVGDLNRAVIDSIRGNFDALVATGKIRAR
jgi:uncharacterized protein YukE